MQGPVAEKLAALWCEVLGRDAVRPDDNFFSCGGHSLLAVRLVSRIQEVFAVPLPLRQLFESPSFSQNVDSIISIMSVENIQPALDPVAAAEVPLGSPVPCSLPQQRLWILQQLLDSCSSYHIFGSLYCPEPFNWSSLNSALVALSARHQSLRTTFCKADTGIPQQVVHSSLQPPISVADASAASPQTAQHIIRGQTNQLQNVSFDLTTGPLLRLGVILLPCGGWVLSVCIHHIIADGWSVELLLQELSQLYSAIGSSTCVEPPSHTQLLPLEVQYTDFSLWQRKSVSTLYMQQQIKYWASKLSGITPLDMPLDFPRPAAAKYTGCSTSCCLPTALSDILVHLCQQFAISPLALYLAVFAQALGLHTPESSVCIGTPVSGRCDPKLMPTVGCFVNTLAIPFPYSPAVPLGEVLQKAKTLLHGMLDNQDAPFEDVIDAVDPTRDTSRNPLFQAFLSVQDADPFAKSMNAMGMFPVNTNIDTAKFDLSLYVSTSHGQTRLLVEYSTALFTRGTAQAVLHAVAHMLWRCACEQPPRPHPSSQTNPQIQILSCTANHRATCGSNDQDGMAKMSDLQMNRTQHCVDCCAISTGFHHMTQGMVVRVSNALASQLSSTGAGPETLVAVLMD
eukprot:gene5960-5848_t